MACLLAGLSNVPSKRVKAPGERQTLGTENRITNAEDASISLVKLELREKVTVAWFTTDYP